MNHDNVAGKFSQEAIALTASVYFIGMNQFEGHKFQQGLAAIFCHAIRFALLNGLEDRTQTSAEVLGEVVDCLAPATPSEAIDAFKSLPPSEFEEWYKRIRIMAGQQGVEIEEFAKTLSNAQEIFRSFDRNKSFGNK